MRSLMARGATGEGNGTGANDLANTVGLQDIQQSVNLLCRTGGLDDHGLGRDVDDGGTEQVSCLEQSADVQRRQPSP